MKTNHLLIPRNNKFILDEETTLMMADSFKLKAEFVQFRFPIVKIVSKAKSPFAKLNGRSAQNIILGIDGNVQRACCKNGNAFDLRKDNWHIYDASDKNILAYKNKALREKYPKNVRGVYWNFYTDSWAVYSLTGEFIKLVDNYNDALHLFIVVNNLQDSKVVTLLAAREKAVTQKLERQNAARQIRTDMRHTKQVLLAGLKLKKEDVAEFARSCPLTAEVMYQWPNLPIVNPKSAIWKTPSQIEQLLLTTPQQVNPNNLFGAVKVSLDGLLFIVKGLLDNDDVVQLSKKFPGLDDTMLSRLYAVKDSIVEPYANYKDFIFVADYFYPNWRKWQVDTYWKNYPL